MPSHLPRWRHTGSFQNLAGEQEISQETIDKFSPHGLATADDQTCADWAEVPNVHQWMEEAAQWLLETI